LFLSRGVRIENLSKSDDENRVNPSHMSPFEVEVIIHAPVDKVFAISADIPNAPRHIPSIKRIDMLTEGEVRAGTKWKETRLSGKKEAVVELQITQFDAPEAYTVAAEAMGSKYRTVLAFEKAPEGTKVVMTTYVESKGFMAGVMASMLEKSVKRGLQEDLDALKRACERGH
jgi:uncharacterized membrane protein